MESLRGQVFRAVGYMCTHEGERMLIWECGRGSPLDGVESRSTSQKREQRTLASFSTNLIEERAWWQVFGLDWVGTGSLIEPPSLDTHDCSNPFWAELPIGTQ